MLDSQPTPIQTGIVKLPADKPRIPLTALLQRAVNHSTKHPAPNSTVMIAGANFVLQGMVSALTSPPKSGKTTVIGYIIATCFMPENDPKETLNISSALANGRNVVYLDFEQHVSSTQDLHDKVLRYSGLKDTPSNLHILNMLEYTLEQRRDAIMTIFEELDLHLIIIDGLADVLTSVNDEEKSNELIDTLSILASKHNTSVLVVIHENKGGGSVRGHLGSQIERKCAGLISIKKDREKKMHSIESRLIRVGDDFDNQYFHWSDEKKCMVLADEAVAKAMIKHVEDQKNEVLATLIAQVFGPLEQMPQADCYAKILQFEPNVDSTKSAERRVKSAIDAGLIIRTGKGKTAIIFRMKPTDQDGASDAPF